MNFTPSLQVRALLGLPIFSSLSLSDMLLVTGGGSGTSFVPLSLSDPLLDLGSLSLSLFVPSFLLLLGVLFYEVCHGFITLHQHPKSGKREKMGP